MSKTDENGVKLGTRRPDGLDLREARDEAIVRMREGLEPFSRPYSWREIARANQVTFSGARRRYLFLCRRHPKVVRAIRDGRLGRFR
jgi:hypothetical protein